MSKEYSIKVTKSYSRKVSLSGISSQYENIERGTYVTSIVSFKDKDELRDKIDFLSDLVFEETEEDIKNTMWELKKKSLDKKNQLVMGTGSTIELERLEENSGIDFDEIKKLLENTENTPTLNLEEVE